MVHIRLDEKTHQNLKIHVASEGTTIQQVVEGLIRQKLGEADTTKANK
jgi:hypothetical protein